MPSPREPGPGAAQPTQSAKNSGHHPINDKRVERIWQREGLKVPHKQPKRGRLWLADGSCIRLRPQQRNHVWSYDFVGDRTHEGRKYRMLNVLDEFSHECLAIRVARKLKAIDVIDVLSDLFILRGIPAYIRQGSTGMDRGCRCQDRLHRARQPLGERLHRELQRSPARRAARRRNLLHSPRGPNRHRELAAPLQHDQAARIAWIQAASTGGICPCLRRVAGCATPTGSAGHAGATASLKLTFHLDHSVGANHTSIEAGDFDTTTTRSHPFMLSPIFARRLFILGAMQYPTTAAMVICHARNNGSKLPI
jgi:hypothetical protein